MFLYPVPFHKWKNLGGFGIEKSAHLIPICIFHFPFWWEIRLPAKPAEKKIFLFIFFFITFKILRQFLFLPLSLLNKNLIITIKSSLSKNKFVKRLLRLKTFGKKHQRFPEEVLSGSYNYRFLSPDLIFSLWGTDIWSYLYF